MWEIGRLTRNAVISALNCFDEEGKSAASGGTEDCNGGLRIGVAFGRHVVAVGHRGGTERAAQCTVQAEGLLVYWSGTQELEVGIGEGDRSGDESEQQRDSKTMGNDCHL